MRESSYSINFKRTSTHWNYLFCITKPVKGVILAIFFLISVNLAGQEPAWEWVVPILSEDSEISYDLVAEGSTGNVYIVGEWNGDLSSTFASGIYPSTNFLNTYGGKDGFVAKYDSNGNVLWSFKIGGAGDDLVKSVALDNAGNIYITGHADIGDSYFSGTTTPAPGDTLKNNTQPDFFIAKYTTDGNLLWLRQAVNDEITAGTTVSTNTNSVFVAGTYKGAPAFGSLTAPISGGDNDFFIIRYDLNGTEDWLFTGGSDKEDIINDIQADNTEIFITGNFAGASLSLVDALGAGIALFPNASDGKSDILIGKLSLSGTLGWVRQIHSIENDQGMGLIFDSDSLYICGSVEEQANFPLYTGNPVSTSSKQDIMIASLSRITGNTGWVKVIPCTDGADEIAMGISGDGLGNLYITGEFRKELHFFDLDTLFAVDHEDIFVASFTGNGDFRWAKQAGCEAGGGGHDFGHAIDAKSPENIYVTGIYGSRTAYFDLINLPYASSDNIFIGKLAQPCIDAVGGFINPTEPNICIGSPTTLVLSGYYGDIEWQSSPPGMDLWTTLPGETAPVLTILPFTSTDYRAYLTSGICLPDSSNIQFIQVDILPVANAGPGGSECDLDFALKASPTIGSGNWLMVSGPGNAVFNPLSNEPTAIVTVDAYGTYEFRWFEVNGTCSDSDTLIVNFYQQPVADAGPGGDECDLDFALQASPSVGSGTWEKVSGPGNAAFSPLPSDPNAIVTVDAYGTYEFRWHEVNGTCSDADTLFVNFFQQPFIDAGPGGDECDLDFALQASPSVGSGTWEKVFGPGNAAFNPLPADPNAIVTVDIYGTYEFRWFEVNGTCSDSDTIIVNFYQQPISEAGPGGDDCDLDFALQAIPSFGTGTWEKVSGPGNAVFNPLSNEPTAIVTVDAYGTYEFRWFEVNGTCSDSDTIIINFFQQPLADAGPGGDICGDFYTFNAAPSVGSGSWSVLSGQGTAVFSPDGTIPDAEVTVYAYGIYEFIWTEKNGPCSDSDTISVNFIEQPNANAGSDRDECGLESLLRALPSVGTGMWDQVSGPGASLFNPDNTQPNVNVMVDSYGTYEFSWTEINGNCIDRDTLIVNFYEQPLAYTNVSGEICGQSYPLLAPTGPGRGYWTQINGIGNAIFEPDSSIANAIVTVDEYGIYAFSWKAINGTCTAESVIDITFLELPVANAGTGGDECDLDFHLEAIPSTGNGIWRAISGPGVVSFGADATISNSIVTVDVYGTYEFEWTETNGECVDADTITVNFYEQPDANAGEGGNVCGLDILLNAVPSVGVGHWDKISGPGDITFSPGISQQSVTASGVSYGSHEVKWMEVNGTCSDRDTIAINFYRGPEAYAGPDQILHYAFETLLEGEFSTNDISTTLAGEWSLITGTGIFDDKNSPVTRVSGLSVGENIFKWSVSNIACPTASDEVIITVNDLIIPSWITPNQDGKNDYFLIRGIENTGHTELTIFDRWGNEVYRTANYMNDWDGKDQNGNELAGDTYLYILKTGDDRTIRGYLVVQR